MTKWVSKLKDFAQLPFSLGSVFSVPLAILLIAGFAFPLIIVAMMLAALITIPMSFRSPKKANEFFSACYHHVPAGIINFTIQFSEKMCHAIFLALTLLPMMLIARFSRKFRKPEYIRPLVNTLVVVNDQSSQKKIMQAVFGKYNEDRSELGTYVKSSVASKTLRTAIDTISNDDEKIPHAWRLFCDYMTASDVHNGKCLFNAALEVLDEEKTKNTFPIDEVVIKTLRSKIATLYVTLNESFWNKKGVGLWWYKPEFVPAGINEMRAVFLDHHVRKQTDISTLAPEALSALALSLQVVANRRMMMAEDERKVPRRKEMTEYMYINMENIIAFDTRGIERAKQIYPY